MGKGLMTSSLPLRGLRVLDFSRILAGPWCTMLLADAGAEVIKLERTGKGEDTRSWGPPFIGDANNPISTYFLSVNRGKKSLSVDLKQERGLDICRRLATEWADVLVENFKGGTMERYGLDFETLSKQNPSLIYCSISGFGPTGPYFDRPGYDVVISGMYGLMSITGDPDGGPAKVGVASTDVLTGTLAQSGILSALYEREKTGLGRKVDVSLMESQLAGLVNIASNVLNGPTGATEPRRWGTAHESIVPYQAFKCKPKNGTKQYVMVGAGNDNQFTKLCQVLGMDSVSKDRRFRTNADRVTNRTALISLLEDRFASKSRDEWVQLLEGKGFPLGPLRTVKEAFSCKQAQARGMVEAMQHSAGCTIRLPRSPISFSSPTCASTMHHANDQYNVSHSDFSKLPPPMLGEHTEDILHNILNLPLEDISEMESGGVVECWRSQQ